MHLRDYQQEAVAFLTRNRHAIAVVPTGGGKTVIGAAALAKLANAHQHTYRPKVVWLAPTNDLVDQIASTAERFPVIGEKLSLHVHTVASQPMTADAHVLIMDEAHHAPARTWAPLAENARGIRWALTATPFHPTDEDRNRTFLGLFSHTMHVVRIQTLTAQGHILSAKFRFIPYANPDVAAKITSELLRIVPPKMRKWAKIPETKTREHLSGKPDPALARNPQLQRACYQLLLTHVIADRRRNELIADMAVSALSRNRRVLVLAQTIAQAEAISNMIPQAVTLSSNTSARRRKKTIAAARVGDVPCIIATSLADEGLDIPRLDTLILAGLGRSPNKITQRAGRILRPHPEKKHPYILDIFDEEHPMLARQARARKRAYLALGFEDYTPQK